VAPAPCERCYRSLEDGPHGVGLCPYEKRSESAYVVPDDIPGGMVFENGLERPTRFFSHSAHRAALAARGREIVAKWAGPGDKHLKRWDVPSAKTLEDARILLSRGKVSAPETVAEDLPPIVKRDIKGPIPEGVQHG
jgi:hypothetical protein